MKPSTKVEETQWKSLRKIQNNYSLVSVVAKQKIN